MSNHVLTLHVLTYTPVIHRLNRSHIRQLLYLALYPPAPSFQNDGDTKNGKDAGLPSSPSKLHAKHQNSIMIPTPPATNAAQDLLMSFSRTNTPESLFRALPRYSSFGTDNTFGDTQQNLMLSDTQSPRPKSMRRTNLGVNNGGARNKEQGGKRTR